MQLEGDALFGLMYWTHFHNGIASKTETKYIITGWMVFKHLMENNNAV